MAIGVSFKLLKFLSQRKETGRDFHKRYVRLNTIMNMEPTVTSSYFNYKRYELVANLVVHLIFFHSMYQGRKSH